MNNSWTRATWGGIAGILVKDLLYWIARAAGWLKLNILGAMARLVTSERVAYSPSGQILGLVMHLILGTVIALLFCVFVKAIHSKNNIITGIVLGLVIWLAYGLSSPSLGFGPSPWVAGTGSTLVTLAGNIMYGAIVGYAVTDTLTLEARP